MSRIDFTDNIRKFGGSIWYVNKGSGSDANSGANPDVPFETIGAGISAASAGDALSIKAGTYTETGLDMNLEALEMWCEIGVVIDPASGTALTVSANFCRITGEHKITPAAGETGLLISGDECVIENSKVLQGAIGIQATGSGIILNQCAVGFQTSIAYDIQAIQGRLYRCKTVGNAATIGYKINAGVDTGVLEACTSSGHQTAGFYIDTGSQDWTLLNCSSGGGDGRWVDVDSTNVWSNFSFSDFLSTLLTFDASGATSANLFRVYGTVLVTELHGEVETVLAGDIGNGYLELDDGTNQVDITDSPGPSFNGVPANSFIHKIDDAAVQIAIEDSSQVRLYEDATKFGRDPNFQVTAKAGAASYIRFTYSDTGTTGAIHWHIRWEPLTEDAWVAAA